MRPIHILGVVFVIWLGGAALLPLVQDEAYYFLWSRHLGFGYFDHPPLVALMSAGSRLADASALAGRAGTLIFAIVAGLALVRFFRLAGLSDTRAMAAAMLLTFGNILGLAMGVLTTPDTPLLLFWTLALSEALLAFRSDPRRWITAGIFTGLGLLSKYTMTLIGLVYLAGLLQDLRLKRPERKPQLLTPWPWLGGLAALLVFMPHLMWNHQNDWITFKFQLRHGLSLERPEFTHNLLPSPLPDDPAAPEARLTAVFAELEEESEKDEKKPAPWDDALKLLNRWVGFYASQIGMWGALLVPVGAAIRSARRRRRAAAGDTDRAHDTGRSAIRVPARPGDSGDAMLLWAAVLVPLALFGLLAMFSKVEANWAAMYVIGASALAAPLLAENLRGLIIAAGINVVIFSAAVTHARTGVFNTRPHRDRLLQETHGYSNLAGLAASLDGPVFADTYQIAAMLRFFQPSLAVQQWPGITRDSEFVRNAALSPHDLEGLQKHGSFWLITSEAHCPRLPGFTAVSMAQLRDCKSHPLQVITGNVAHDFEHRCKRPVHEWYLIRYQTQSMPTAP